MNNTQPNSITHVLQSYREPDQPIALLNALEQAVRVEIGHIFMTCFAVDAKQMLATRIYTSLADNNNYPTGGAKDMCEHPWGECVIHRHETFIANTAQEIERVFPDAQAIFDLGCAACLSVPTLWRGEVIGAINICHREHWFSAEHIKTGEQLAPLLLPALLSRAE